MKTPPGITYIATYEPNMERMVAALNIVRQIPSSSKKKDGQDELLKARCEEDVAHVVHKVK